MAGVKHLFMDMGYGETLESGPIFAKVSMASAVVLMVLAGVGMVTNVLNYGRSGVADWVVQRFSALILAAYTVVMVIWHGSER